MKDIAERAGVSLSTVSVVLSGSRRLAISDETRRSVLAIAKELNYHLNAHASNLAKRSSNLFGLVISEIANPFFPEVIRSFESAATARGFEMRLFNTEYDPERSQRAVSMMITSNVCGAAVFTSKFARPLLAQLSKARIPAVLVRGGLTEPKVGTIQIDFGHGISQAMEYLIALGHTRFCAITGPDEIPSAKLYARAFLKTAKRLKVRNCPVFSCNYRHDGGMAAVRSIFQAKEIPTAILCANDLIALGAISELQRAGMSVPEDLSVVGFDDLVFAHLARPPLTTVAVPRNEIGSLAFHMLLKMQTSDIIERHRVEPRLILRGSTAAPPDSTNKRSLPNPRKLNRSLP